MSVSRLRYGATRPARTQGAPALAGVLAALALAACGGAGQTAPTPTSTQAPSGGGSPVALKVQPGIGIGPISIGESRSEIRAATPELSSRTGAQQATYAAPGGAVTVDFSPRGRAEIIISSSIGLTIYGGRLASDRSMIAGRMRADGWTVARCPHGGLTATRKESATGRITRVNWPGTQGASAPKPNAGVYPAHLSFPGEFGCPGAGGRRPL